MWGKVSSSPPGLRPPGRIAGERDDARGFNRTPDSLADARRKLDASELRRLDETVEDGRCQPLDDEYRQAAKCTYLLELTGGLEPPTC